MAPPTCIKIALDWTPNTNHTGLYVALERGFYKEHNLDVRLVSPDPSYSTTPAKQLERGEVDLAICPSESCIAYRESGKMQLQAIFAILQRDASAIVSTKLDNIGDLGKGVYGSYNARYEDDIVRAMVGHDGGQSSKMNITNSAGKLDLFEELKRGNIDATWIFVPWEGVEAEMEGLGLNIFKAEDYGVPYGYSPVIAWNAASSAVSKETLRSFVAATKKGYTFAKDNVQASAAVLSRHCQPSRSEEFLIRSQTSINDFYGTVDEVGCMQEEKWQSWLQWLKDNELLKTNILAGELFIAMDT